LISKIYSLDDLEKVQRELAELLDAEDRYTGNNPNKYQSGIQALVSQRDEITAALKRQNDIPETKDEKLNRLLDQAFPKAHGKQVVVFEGHRYKKDFRPAEHSRSGKSVTRWESWWEQLVEI
jgi:hypothetical protein